MHSADHGCWGICVLKNNGLGGGELIASCCSSYYLLLEGSQPRYMAGNRHALFISFTKTSSKTDRWSFHFQDKDSDYGTWECWVSIDPARNGDFDGWVLPHDVHCCSLHSSAVRIAGRAAQSG